MNLIPLYLACGAVLGLWHFGSLEWLSRHLLARGSLGSCIGLHLLRLAVLALVGYWCARHGASALGAWLLGLLATRSWLLHRVRQTASAEAR